MVYARESRLGVMASNAKCLPWGKAAKRMNVPVLNAIHMERSGRNFP
jgi:hypothetical protein